MQNFVDMIYVMITFDPTVNFIDMIYVIWSCRKQYLSEVSNIRFDTMMSIDLKLCQS